MQIRGITKSDFDAMVSVFDRWWGGPSPLRPEPFFFYELGHHGLLAESDGAMTGFLLGFVSDLGALGEWGMTLVKDEIVVNSLMETGRLGIYAAGDVTTYPGKLKLIATGFAEAATAVNQAVHWIYPEKKVAPGHSSNMAVFGQRDD